jgi:LysM repeat protein
LCLVVLAALIAVGAFFVLRDRQAGPQEAVAGSPEGGSPAQPTGEQAATIPTETQTRREPTPVAAALAAPTERSQNPQAPATAPASQPPKVETPPNPQVAAIIQEAAATLGSQPGQIITVRDKLNAALSLPMSDEQRHAIKKQMASLAEQWLFGPAVLSGDKLCGTYKVARGDILDTIGRRHKVPYEILMRINNIVRPESLAAGRTIKIINGPFHTKIYKSTFSMDLYLQDTYVRSFNVGLGAPGSETPTGLWRVQDGGRLIQPPWYDERSGRTYTKNDPDYPLGSRWIALDGVEGNAKGRVGFAIHGTKAPDEIGKATSQGCIRMHNGQATLVYDMLFPLYSTVEVFD